jgi:hypothetical protein
MKNNEYAIYITDKNKSGEVKFCCKDEETAIQMAQSHIQALDPDDGAVIGYVRKLILGEKVLHSKVYEEEYVKCFYPQQDPPYLIGYSDFVKAAIERKTPYRLLVQKDAEWTQMTYSFTELRKLYDELDGLEGMDNARNAIRTVVLGKVPKCESCGCYYTALFPISYRDNGGCVSKSCECSFCVSLNSERVARMQEIFRTSGVEGSVEHLITLLQKSHNPHPAGAEYPENMKMYINTKAANKDATMDASEL